MRRRGLLQLAAGIPLAGAGSGAAPAGAATVAGAPRGRVAGLLAREDHLVRPGNQKRLRGLVLRLPWSIAQPTPDSVFDCAAKDLLDQAEAAAPADYPFLKLRLLAGADSPPWALELGDGPLTGWKDPEDSSEHTVPQWWSDGFLTAYEGLLVALAGVLDDRPRWAEVTVSATCTVYAEPCVKQFGVAANREKALGIGYTDAADQAALKRAMAAHDRILTPLGITSSVAYNPWQTIADRALKVCPATTIDLMEHQKNTMGAYGVWANNSLSARWVDGEPVQSRPEYEEMYQHMVTAARGGHPVQFQTATLAKIQAAEQGSVFATASWAARNKAVSVELPRGWEQDEDVIDLARADELNRQFGVNAGATVR